MRNGVLIDVPVLAAIFDTGWQSAQADGFDGCLTRRDDAVLDANAVWHFRGLAKCDPGDRLSTPAFRCWWVVRFVTTEVGKQKLKL